MLRSKTFHLVLGITISSVFLFFAIRNVNFKEFRGQINRLNFLYVLPAILTGLIAYIVRAWRWRYFLEGVGKFGFFRLLSATMIGFMSNNVLPARIGEIIRAFVVNRKESVDFLPVFGSLIAERVVDGLTVSILALPVIHYLPLAPEIKLAGKIFFGLFLSLAILLFILSNSLFLQNLLIRLFPAPFGLKLNRFFVSFFTGFKGLKDVKNFGIIFISAFPIWFLSALYFYFMGIAMDIPISISASFGIFISVALSVVIPSSPGFIGVYHYFCSEAIQLYGVNKSDGLAYAVVTHFVQYVAVTGIGLLFLLYEGISFKELKEGAEMEEVK